MDARVEDGVALVEVLEPAQEAAAPIQSVAALGDVTGDEPSQYLIREGGVVPAPE